MNRKAILALALAALGAASSTATAQQLAPGPAPALNAPAAPAGAVPLPAPLVSAPAGGLLSPGPAPAFNPVGPMAAPANPPIAVAPQAFGMQPIVSQGIPIAPGATPTYFTPQQTVALTNTYTTGSPLVTQQTQVYTPTFYYYYYTPPYYVSYSPVAAPTAAPMMAVGAYDLSGMGGQMGPMMNARGEMGHVRYPYYSYRRPWYYPGQPSFNVTIDGPVW